MKLPSGSNTMTGGAATATWSGLSVRGRCRTHAFPCASIAMLDTSPSFHFAGTFGHEVSTSNRGRSRGCAWEVCAAASVSNSHILARPATMANAIRTAPLEFLRFMAYLLKVQVAYRYFFCVKTDLRTMQWTPLRISTTCVTRQSATIYVNE